MLRQGALSSNILSYTLTMPKLIQIKVQCLFLGSMLLVGSMWRDYPFPPRNGDLGGVQSICREIWIPLQLMAVWVQSLCPSMCQHRDWSVSAPWFIRTCSTLSQLTHMLVSNDGDGNDDVLKMAIWISNWFASARLSVLWPAVAFLKSVLRNSCRPIQTCVSSLYLALFYLQPFWNFSPRVIFYQSWLVQNIERSHKTKPVVELLSLVLRMPVAPACDYKL